MIYWVGNMIHNNVAHLCTSRGTFLRINGKTTLSLLDATAADVNLKGKDQIKFISDADDNVIIHGRERF